MSVDQIFHDLYDIVQVLLSLHPSSFSCLEVARWRIRVVKNKANKAVDEFVVHVRSCLIVSLMI